MYNEFLYGLTDITLKLIDIVFSECQKQIVINIIKSECGNNLPLCEGFSPKQLERIRFAVIKYSEGQIDKLNSAIELANIDWRDLLLEVGFANDINFYNEWAKNVIGIKD